MYRKMVDFPMDDGMKNEILLDAKWAESGNALVIITLISMLQISMLLGM